MNDNVNKPAHYLNHPSGVECISVSEKLGFNLGSAFKYLFRCNDKGDALQDLNKARWYLKRELKCREQKRIYWFSESDTYDARWEGSHSIILILAYESRYMGHMCHALERIYTASIQKRGVRAIQAAIRCVEATIRIENHRQSNYEAH